MRLPSALALLLLALGCGPSSGPDGGPSNPPTGGGAAVSDAPESSEVSFAADESNIRTHLEFLASDAQMGRLPGTDADGRVQSYVEGQMKAVGLSPAFGDGYRQVFSVTDGVRSTGESSLAVGTAVVDHGLVPFSTSTAAPVAAKLVFVGYGIAPEGKGSGDYKGLAAKVKGNIVVALGGSPPDDPHLSAAVTRPQSKVIAARDLGAVGFVLWEPDQSVAYPNHGAVSDLEMPVVWVGKSGSAALLRAFGAKFGARRGTKESIKVDPVVAAKGLAKGKRSRARATLHTPLAPITIQTANISGVLSGAEGSPVLVVGAHMDHLGEGTPNSLAPGIEAIHNGADDNASGVAVILEMARVLAAMPAQERPYSIHFIAFGAEEMGLLGSKHYVQNIPPALRGRMVGMLNFDMVGRLGKEQGLVVAGVGTSPAWTDLLERSRDAQEIRVSDDGYGASDQTSFYEAGLPVLHFFTGTHSDYHKPSDDIDKINFGGAATIATIATRVIHAVSSEGIALDYIKVIRKAPTRGGFRVSLGTIPDYGAKVDGVRLTGVREGGAAAEAGLTKGDVIQKIGEREIHNLDDYMATFAVLTPDTPVDVVVLRDGKQVTMTMKPQAPKRR